MMWKCSRVLSHTCDCDNGSCNGCTEPIPVEMQWHIWKYIHGDIFCWYMHYPAHHGISISIMESGPIGTIPQLDDMRLMKGRIIMRRPYTIIRRDDWLSISSEEV